MSEEDSSGSTDMCRICHESRQEQHEALISPCDCQGSLRYVHASCMDRWRLLNMDNANRVRCQLCRAPFRLVESGRFSDLLSMVGSYRGVYELALRSVAVCTLVPLSVAAITLSNLLKRDEVYRSGPVDMEAKPWRASAFAPLVSAARLDEINQLIGGRHPRDVSRSSLLLYGLTVLGRYACTAWLFADGMAEWVPIQTVGPDGRLRSSPLLAVIKALLEFYFVPFAMRTPESRARLPLFVASTGVGLWYVVSRVEARLRAYLLELLPRCKRLELGTLASH
jgi:hypothetical protein